jgi:transcriptional regulator with XRE-family HTH domain
VSREVEEFMPKFSERLKALRKERGLKQREMAEICGLKMRGYQQYEYDETYPTVPGLVFLADYFDVSTDYLLGRTDCREVKRTNP